MLNRIMDFILQYDKVLYIVIALVFVVVGEKILRPNPNNNDLTQLIIQQQRYNSNISAKKKSIF